MTRDRIFSFLADVEHIAWASARVHAARTHADGERVQPSPHFPPLLTEKQTPVNITSTYADNQMAGIIMSRLKQPLRSSYRNKLTSACF